LGLCGRTPVPFTSWDLFSLYIYPSFHWALLTSPWLMASPPCSHFFPTSSPESGNPGQVSPGQQSRCAWLAWAEPEARTQAERRRRDLTAPRSRLPPLLVARLGRAGRRLPGLPGRLQRGGSQLVLCAGRHKALLISSPPGASHTWELASRSSGFGLLVFLPQSVKERETSSWCCPWVGSVPWEPALHAHRNEQETQTGSWLALLEESYRN